MSCLHLSNYAMKEDPKYEAVERYDLSLHSTDTTTHKTVILWSRPLMNWATCAVLLVIDDGIPVAPRAGSASAK
ncbi:MAG: hypothetical protein ACI9R3_004042 [Verrucomicrobiales bacterium]|jgi:hypothetical protein